MSANSRRRQRQRFRPSYEADMAAVVSILHRSLVRERASLATTSEEGALQGLQEVAGRSRSGEECAVCLRDFDAGETLRAMPCAHAFHQHCIFEWLRRSPVCPICRHRLPQEDEGNEERKRRRTLDLDL